MVVMRDRWQEAVALLSDDEKALLKFDGSKDRAEILTQVLQVVEEKRVLCYKKAWKYHRKNGQVVILRDVWEKMAVWIQKFREVGDVVASYDPAHAALPWAGMRFIINIFTNDVQTFGAMVEGLEEMSNTITRYAILEQVHLKAAPSSATEKLSQAVTNVYASTLRFLARARKYFESSTVERAVKSVVQPLENTVAAYRQDLVKWQSEADAWTRVWDAQLQVQIDQSTQETVSEQKRLAAILHDLDIPINRMATELNDLHQELKKARRRQLMEWLSTVPYKKHHEANLKDCLPGTGNWLFQKPQFRDWIGSSVSSVLWLHGIPGSGKSKLVSLLVDKMQSDYCKGANYSPLAFFYCQRNQAEKMRSDPDAIIRSILKQLAILGPTQPIRKPVMDMFERKEQEADEDGSDIEPLTFDEAVTSIIQIANKDPIFIVIDAMDECDPARRFQLLQALDKIIQDSNSLVKVFVSSRDDSDIVCRLETSPNIFINVQDNTNDIEAFINAEVNAAIEERRLIYGNVSDQLKKKIITKLRGGAQGMFRWVSLQIQNLCDHQRIKHETDVIEELGRLPKSLEALYDMIFDQIRGSAKSSRSIAERAFKWLICSPISLRVDMLLEAVSFEPSGHDLVVTERDLLNMCCNLIQVDPELQVLRFAHLSVREYLEKMESFMPISTNSFVISTCILSCQRSLAKETFEDLFHKTLQDGYDFPIFAFNRWPSFYAVLDEYDVQNKVVQDFFFNGNNISTSFQDWYHIWQKPSLDFDSPLLHLLFLASDFYWKNMIKKLGQIPSNILEKRSSAWTPLLHASYLGYSDTVRLLLDSGADINARADDDDGHRGCSALHLAAWANQVECVEELLDRGAEVDTKVEDNSRLEQITALDFAVEAKAYTTILALLRRGARLERMNHKYAISVLHLACNNDRLEILESLLEQNPDVEVREGNGFTPLHTAVREQNLDAARLLLAKGASINAKVTAYKSEVLERLWGERSSFLGCTSLHISVENVEQPMVELLIENGADINARSTSGETPLHIAARQGHLGIMKLLLDHGADVNLTTSSGQTPLHKAAWTDHDILDLLLRHNVDVNAVMVTGETALDRVRETDQDSIKVLLKYGGHFTTGISSHHSSRPPSRPSRPFSKQPSRPSRPSSRSSRPSSRPSRPSSKPSSRPSSVDGSKQLTISKAPVLEEFGQLAINSKTSALDESPDQLTVLPRSSSDGPITSHPVSSKKPGFFLFKELLGHTDEAWAAAFSHDGKFLATGSVIGQVKIWDIETTTSIIDITFGSKICGLAWDDQDESIFILQFASQLGQYDCKTGQLIREYGMDYHNYFAIPFQGNILFGSTDRAAGLWMTKSDTVTKTWNMSNPMAGCISENSILVTGDHQSNIFVIDLKSGLMIYHFKLAEYLSFITITRDSRYAYIVTSGEKCYLVDIKTGEIVQRYTGRGKSKFVLKGCISGNEEYVISGHEDKIVIWDIWTGQLVQTLEIPNSTVCNQCVSNPMDPSMFASVSDDGVVRIWLQEE